MRCNIAIIQRLKLEDDELCDTTGSIWIRLTDTM